MPGRGMEMLIISATASYALSHARQFNSRCRAEETYFLWLQSIQGKGANTPQKPLTVSCHPEDPAVAISALLELWEPGSLRLGCPEALRPPR